LNKPAEMLFKHLSDTSIMQFSLLHIWKSKFKDIPECGHITYSSQSIHFLKKTKKQTHTHTQTVRIDCL